MNPPPVLRKKGPAPGEVDGRVWKNDVRRGGRNHLFLHILSDPIWVGKWLASLKVYKKFSWGGP